MSRLKEVLKAHGITQKELAEATGTTESTISRLISGDVRLRVETATGIAKALTQLTGRPWSLDELVGNGEAAA